MKVALFVPCYVDQFYPQVARATLDILERQGCQVDVPLQQTCCGQPMANSGLERASVPIYQHFVATFSGYDYIVAPSASCVYHVRHHYDIMPQSAIVEHTRKQTLDLTTFLLDVLKIKDLKACFPHKVGLHQSCHGLRGLRMARSSELQVPPYSRWQELLSMVDGIELISLDRQDECCGFGGSFALAEEAVSVQMGQDRIDDHVTHGAAYITSGDMSCLMHLEGIIRHRRQPIKVIHLAEILNSTKS